MAHDLRMLLRELAGRGSHPTAVILDGRTAQSTPESGARAGYDGHKRRKGSKVHIAVDTLGHLLALKVTPANESERAQVGALAEAVQAATAGNVQISYVDQGYTGPHPHAEAAEQGIQLIVIKLAAAQAWLRTLAAALGGRTLLCLGRPFSPSRARLRTTRTHLRRLSLARFPRSHAEPVIPLKCMTRSRQTKVTLGHLDGRIVFR